MQKLRHLIAFFLFATFPATFYYFSPYLSTRWVFEWIVSGSLFFFLCLFLFSIVFGRVFCGWFCPAWAVQDSCVKIQNKRESGKWDFFKYVIWVPWVAVLVFGALKTGWKLQLQPWYMTELGLSATNWPSYIMFFLVFLGISVPALIFGKRAFCHRLCWMSPFMILGAKLGNFLRLPRLRLASDKEKCEKCDACSNSCPMSLDVRNMVQTQKMYHKECILCQTCVSVCPKKAIYSKFLNKNS